MLDLTIMLFVVATVDALVISKVQERVPRLLFRSLANLLYLVLIAAVGLMSQQSWVGFLCGILDSFAFGAILLNLVGIWSDYTGIDALLTFSDRETDGDDDGHDDDGGEGEKQASVAGTCN